MSNTKIWGIVAVLLFVGVIGVFAFRHSEMVGAKKPHSVSLHWDASPNAASYNVYRRTEATEFSKIGSSQTPTYVDNTVPYGAVLYYGVTTVASDGNESKISTIVRVEIPKD
jgi:fibronectin type 3 domain-containing protein